MIVRKVAAVIHREPSKRTVIAVPRSVVTSKLKRDCRNQFTMFLETRRWSCFFLKFEELVALSSSMNEPASLELSNRPYVFPQHYPACWEEARSFSLMTYVSDATHSEPTSVTVVVIEAS